MKVDLSEPISQYNEMVQKGLKFGDKKKLATIKKKIKEMNGGSLKGINKFLHKIKYHKKGEMEGGFLGTLAAMALRKYAWKAGKFLAKKAAKRVAKAIANRVKERVKKRIEKKVSNKSKESSVPDKSLESSVKDTAENAVKQKRPSGKYRRPVQEDELKGEGIIKRPSVKKGLKIIFPKEGSGFKFSGGDINKSLVTEDTHKEAQKYMTKKHRQSYFIPVNKVIHGGYNTGFLDNSKKYNYKKKYSGTGELEYFMNRPSTGSGYKHMGGAGFRHAGAGLFDAKQLKQHTQHIRV